MFRLTHDACMGRFEHAQLTPGASTLMPELRHCANLLQGQKPCDVPQHLLRHLVCHARGDRADTVLARRRSAERRAYVSVIKPEALAAAPLAGGAGLQSAESVQRAGPRAAERGCGWLCDWCNCPCLLQCSWCFEKVSQLANRTEASPPKQHQLTRKVRHRCATNCAGPCLKIKRIPAAPWPTTSRQPFATRSVPLETGCRGESQCRRNCCDGGKMARR